MRQALLQGNKKDVLAIYSEIVSQAAAFYLPIMPMETGRAKASFENVGRWLVEKFPVLAVTDNNKSSWAVVNGRISQAMRNARCSVKRKLNNPSSHEDKKLKKEAKKSTVSVRVSVREMLSLEEYNDKKEELKKEALKSTPDDEHLKLLLEATHINRREWLTNNPSTKLRLKDVMEQFPVFGNVNFIIIELWMILGGEDQRSSFTG